MQYARAFFLVLVLVHFSSSKVIEMQLFKVDENVKSRWCGKLLIEAVGNVCNRLNDPPKTRDSKEGRDINEEYFPYPYGEGDRVSWRKSMRPGIVAECCFKACSLKYIKDYYCAE